MPDDLGLVERAHKAAAFLEWLDVPADGCAVSELNPPKVLRDCAATIERLLAERDEANSAFGSLIVALAQSGLGVRDKTAAERAAAGDDKCALVVVNRPLESAEAHRDKLAKALKPFGRLGAKIPADRPGSDLDVVSTSWLRRARQALEDTP